MSKTTIKLPKWLTRVIKKYSKASVDEVTAIFEAYFEENTVDSPRFEKLVKRLLKRSTITKKFFDVLDAQGYFDLEEEEEEEEEEEAEAEEAEVEEVEEEEEELESDDDDELEEEEEEEDDSAGEEEEQVEEGGAAEDEEEVGYDATGVPTLEEVTELVSTDDDSYGHIEEFEDPSHLLIAAKVLDALGFDVVYDSRCGGSVKRPRGGKFQLEIDVFNKKAVKRRGKVAPVFAFTNQIIEVFDEQREALIEELVSNFTSNDEADED